MGNQISYGQTLRDVPSASHLPNTYCQQHQLPSIHTLLANWSSFQCPLSATPSDPPPHSWPTHQTTTSLLADWSSLQCTLLANPSDPPPHSWPTGHHSNAPCWPSHSQLTGHHSNVPCLPPHQTHHPTVGQLVITLTYPVSWSIRPPLHCWPTGHHSNVPCRPTHQTHHPTVSWLVITPTPWSADRLSLDLTTPTYLVSHPVSSPTLLSADPLAALLLCSQPCLLNHC